MSMQSAASREALLAAELCSEPLQLWDGEDGSGANGFGAGGGYVADSDSSMGGGLDRLLESQSSLESVAVLVASSAGRPGLPLPLRTGSGRAGGLPAAAPPAVQRVHATEDGTPAGPAQLEHERLHGGSAVEQLPGAGMGSTLAGKAAATQPPAEEEQSSAAVASAQDAEPAHANGNSHAETTAGGLSDDLFAGLTLG
jgi:hypothetical protein